MTRNVVFNTSGAFDDGATVNLVSSIKKTGGTARTGAIVLDPGSNMTITDNGDGSFTIASTGAGANPDIGYSQITSTVNITDTSEATATALIPAITATFSGAPVWCEFFAMAVSFPTNAAGANLSITLFEGSTEIGRLCNGKTNSVTAQLIIPMTGKYKFTPSAGSHTYKLCGFVSSTTGTPNIMAGPVTASQFIPAYFRFYYA